MPFAVVFPGQGSQSVGMLSGLAADYPLVRECFDQAAEALHYDLWAVTQHGPAEALDETRRTQPALLTAEVAVWRVWQQQGGPMPVAMAGHSLGEYTALVCAGALEFADAVSLVEYRGEVMQAAVPQGMGAMAAVLGLDDADVKAACLEAADDQVVAAVNYNAPGQVVIAGHKDAVSRAIAVCKEKGAKRAVFLPVSAPSHCDLMLPAAEKLAARLATTNIQSPRIPVVHNVDVQSHMEPDQIRKALVAQLHNPVRWVEVIRALRQQVGATAMMEAGPGKVLAGLNRRIDRDIPVWSVHDTASLAAAMEELKNA